ncbi:hypothetical protein [Mesorhizobium sp. A556]
MPDNCVSAGRSLSAMAVPPAAKMARFNADLSRVASKAIVASITFLNQSPENPDQLVCSYRAGAGQTHAVFLTQTIPPPRAHACEIRRNHPAFIALCEGRPWFRLRQEVAWKGGSRIAVIHHRFYGQAGWKATLFPMPAKRRIGCVVAEKGLVNLLWIPIVNQLRADPRWRTAFKKKRPVESG